MFRQSQLLNIIRGKNNSITAKFIRGLLWMLIPVYWLGWKLKSLRYRSDAGVVRVDVPVVSIGNITTGGTGKTPLVRWIVQHLQDLGERPVILSRGYGAARDQQKLVNDEFRELKWYLPDVEHLQNPDRVAAAQQIVSSQPGNVIVLDDGFQHRRLARDLNILVVDATCPFGFGYLLPRGLLREPLQELKRADLVIINRCNLVSAEVVVEIQETLSHYTSAPVCQANVTAGPFVGLDRQPVSSSALTQDDVFAFAGIGNPENFLATLQNHQINPTGFQWFPDHHVYRQSDVDQLLAASGKSDVLVCTLKDLVKLEPLDFASKRVVALTIDIQIQGNQLEHALQRVMAHG